jgi:hypothetical protein
MRCSSRASGIIPPFLCTLPYVNGEPMVCDGSAILAEHEIEGALRYHGTVSLFLVNRLPQVVNEAPHAPLLTTVLILPSAPFFHAAFQHPCIMLAPE